MLAVSAREAFPQFGLAFVDSEGVVLYRSPAIAEISGYSDEERLGRSVFDIIHREDQPAIRAALAAITQTAGATAHVQFRYRHQDGVWRRVEASLTNLLREPRVAAIVAHLRDVTDRLAREADIASQHQLLQIIADSAPVYIAYLDPQLRYLFANTAYAARFGLTPAQIAGRTLPEVLGPAARNHLQDFLETALAGRPVEFEQVVPYSHIGSRYMHITHVPDLDENGRVRGLVIVSSDITERKEAEASLRAKNEEISAMSQQLWQTARLATMGELAAGIAHELNNPLAIISLRLEVLANQLPPDSPAYASLKVMEGEIERMSRLIAELLNSSRRGARQVTTVNVVEELEGTLEFVRFYLRSRRVALQRQFAPSVPAIQADRQHLRQVFLNLLTNACDAMPQGGRLTVSAGPGLADAGAPAVLISVADTGVGIPPDVLPRLWEPFYTTKPEGRGTGLGLPICRRVVEEHGGTIRVESREGHGTTFHITLPAAAPAGPLD